MKVLLLVVIIFLATPFLVSARIFDECSLARELKRFGVPGYELSDWVCIAKYESSFNTKAVGPPNWDGSRDWGLFQINDRYWCQADGRNSANLCRMSCNSLLSDDIGGALKCARLIKQQQGWGAWVAWRNRCQGNKPNVGHC